MRPPPMPSSRRSACKGGRRGSTGGAGAGGGLDGRTAPRAGIGLTLFGNRLEDAIANVTRGRGPGTFPGVGFVAAGGEYRQRQNLDSIQAEGIELDARYAFG